MFTLAHWLSAGCLLAVKLFLSLWNCVFWCQSFVFISFEFFISTQWNAISYCYFSDLTKWAALQACVCVFLTSQYCCIVVTYGSYGRYSDTSVLCLCWPSTGFSPSRGESVSGDLSPTWFQVLPNYSQYYRRCPPAVPCCPPAVPCCFTVADWQLCRAVL